MQSTEVLGLCVAASAHFVWVLELKGTHSFPTAGLSMSTTVLARTTGNNLFLKKSRILLTKKKKRVEAGNSFRETLSIIICQQTPN